MSPRKARARSKVGERRTTPRRKRRRPGEARTLFLDAAREVFAEHGYARASTREIARKAGVSEALLFRHFDTKAKLFEQAVIEPIHEFIHAWVEEWKEQAADTYTMESIAEAYIRGLYRLLIEHRELVVALFTAHAYESRDDLDASSPFHRLLEEIEPLAAREVEVRGVEFDVPVAVRLLIGMIMSMAVLDPWLFPPGTRRPSRERIVNEMVALVVHGLSRPAPKRDTTRRTRPR